MGMDDMSDQRLYRSVIHVLWSPVRFFRARAGEEPSWLGALAPVFFYCLAASAAAIVSVAKGQALLAAVTGTSGGGIPIVAMAFGAFVTFASSWMLFALHAGLAVLLDAVWSGSGRARRLVEFTGYAYLPSFLWSVATVVVLVVWWDPEPFRVPSAVPMSDLPRVVAEYQVRLSASPVQIALRTVGFFVSLWLVALQAGALRVLSGFSVSGAVAAALVMGAILVVVPFLWPWLWAG
jgi:hypothetical protein